jgi:hypothetical protein
MRTILSVLIIVAACGEEQDVVQAEPTRCEQLREHLIDIRLSTAPKADRDGHRDAMRNALGSGFLAECGQMSSRELDCAIEATDFNDAAACSTR